MHEDNVMKNGTSARAHTKDTCRARARPILWSHQKSVEVNHTEIEKEREKGMAHKNYSSYYNSLYIV